MKDIIIDELFVMYVDNDIIDSIIYTDTGLKKNKEESFLGKLFK